MARSFTYRGFKNKRGQPLINVKVEAFNTSTGASLETKYTDSSGDVALTALPDDAEATLKFTWGNQVEEVRLGRSMEQAGSSPLIGFFDATKVVKQNHIADPTDLATCITAITAINALLETYGLMKTS